MWSSPNKQPNQDQILDHISTKIVKTASKGPSKDDLHQWSIYRQNLNGALTNNSSIHPHLHPLHHQQHQMLNAQDLTLDPETVDNILASKQYTSSSPDADHYLKYGLPRVKSFKNQSSSDQPTKLSGLVRNFVEKFENQNLNSSSSFNAQNLNRKFSARKENANLSLNDDLNYKLNQSKEEMKSNKSATGNSSPNNREQNQSLEKKFNKRSNKQWMSNPNLQETICSVSDSCLSKQFRQMNKQSMSAFDVRSERNRNDRYEDEMNKLSMLDRLEQFRKYQNESKLDTPLNNNSKSDTDDSLIKSSPCDELDFRKSSLNDSFGEPNSQGKYLPIKAGMIQSSDSEFVLSLMESKSQVSGKTTKQPHLIVNKLYHEFDSTSTLSLLCGGLRQKIRVLDNVNFEAKASDMVALIATNPLESSQILDIMMNQHSRCRSRTFTEIYLNGQLIDEARLSKLCAYVGPSTNNLCSQMSTRQTILFYNLLQSSARENNTFDSKKRIDAVLEELNLSDVKHTSVSNLNESEKIRLQIAIAMMLDTEILLLDQPIRQMDIFDSYFIIDYIRQWTLMTGKIAILALQPPSYETLSLFNKISLISTGRTIYFGDRSKMNAYFTACNYPCPQYKSPADYYLDLITVDHLSMSAMSESNVRIESLVQLYQKSGKKFKRRKSSSTNQLHSFENRQNSSFVIDSLSLFIRAMIFCFPYNVINLAKRLLLAVSLSLICGCIFFKMRLGREQENVLDRIGFYHTLIAIFSIPLFLHEIKSIHNEKKHVLDELRLKVYSKRAYFLSYLIYTLPGSTLVFLGYILPASSLAIIQGHDLLYYIVIMTCYLQVIRLLTIAVSWSFSSKIRSSIAFGLIYFIAIMSSGQNLHFKNSNIVSRLAQNLSLYTWTYETMINWEFDSIAILNNSTTSTNNLPKMMINQRFLCTNNPLVEKAAIVARAECGIQSKNHILDFMSMTNYFINWTQPLIVYLSYTSIFLFIWYLVLCVLTANNSHLLSVHLKESSSFKKRCCKPEYL